MWYLYCSLFVGAVLIGLLWDEPISLGDKLVLITLGMLFWPLVSIILTFFFIQEKKFKASR